MRVAVSLFQFYPGLVGGAGNYIQEMIPRLFEFMGSEDRLLLCGSDENLRPFASITEPRCERMLFTTTRRGTNLRRFGDLLGLNRSKLWGGRINEWKPDLLFCPQQSIFPNGVAAPCVVTILDLLHQHYPSHFSLLDRWIRWRKDCICFQKGASFIAISEWSRDDILARQPSLSGRVHAIPLAGGIKPAFSQDQLEIELINEAYVLYPAFPYLHKNHRRLLEAFASIPEKSKGKLILVGRLAPWLEKLVAKTPGVEHLGFVTPERLKALYRGAKGVILPSLFEGFGIPIVEAMHYGKPIWCSRIPTFQEIAGDSVQYFDPESNQEIVQALSAAFRLEHRNWIDYSAILSRYSWERCARETWSVFLQSRAHLPGEPVARI